jgi:hypothetical protein
METQIFHHAKNIIFKKSSKRNQNPSRYDVQPHHIYQCHQCQFEEILGCLWNTRLHTWCKELDTVFILCSILQSFVKPLRKKKPLGIELSCCNGFEVSTLWVTCIKYVFCLSAKCSHKTKNCSKIFCNGLPRNFWPINIYIYVCPLENLWQLVTGICDEGDALDTL